MIIKKKMNHQKKVVYLFGTGVTQAEIKLKGGTSGVLMRDVKDEILRKIEKDKSNNLVDIKNELTSEYADVEHLITLYESTGIPKHERIAKHLKRLFKEVVQERTNKLKPTLLLALIDMHEIQKLNEELVGILTLNYEDILEQAIQDVKGGINYSIDISYTKNSYLQKREIFPLLKLHGSFNWANEFPITLTNDKKTKDTDHALWIPPGVEKRKERYPFSIIWGRAKEILNCDVLRVIGCSLNRNDWQLVSLLYTTQKLNNHRNDYDYDIELIDYFDKGKKISREYSYLKFRLISEIKEVKEYLNNAFLKPSENDTLATEDIEKLLSNETNNIFDIWLKAKGDDLRNRNIELITHKKYFENYITGVI